MQNLNDMIKTSLMSRYTRYKGGLSVNRSTKKSCSTCGGNNSRIITPTIREANFKQTRSQCTSCTKIFDMHGN
jgi:DNA-directed RNA polymerase subunit M/transcription elongation factor TFIIS